MVTICAAEVEIYRRLVPGLGQAYNLDKATCWHRSCAAPRLVVPAWSRYDVESLLADNRTAAGSGDIVVHQLLSVSRDGAPPFLFGFSHKPANAFIFLEEICRNFLGCVSLDNKVMHNCP